MRTLRNLQVNLGRLLVYRSGLGQISPKMRMTDLIEPLRQSHQHNLRLACQQILEKCDGPGARHRTPECGHGSTHVLGDLAIGWLQIVPARIQNTGGCERHGVGQTDVIEEDHRGSARVQVVGIVVVIDDGQARRPRRFDRCPDEIPTRAVHPGRISRPVDTVRHLLPPTHFTPYSRARPDAVPGGFRDEPTQRVGRIVG